MPKGIPNKRYTGEFKQEVIETMQREKLSYRETARLYEINDHKRVMAWERIYLEEGAEGLYIDHRGQGSKGRPPKQLKPEVEEDMLAEVQRLRAENDYLSGRHEGIQRGCHRRDAAEEDEPCLCAGTTEGDPAGKRKQAASQREYAE